MRIYDVDFSDRSSSRSDTLGQSTIDRDIPVIRSARRDILDVNRWRGERSPADRRRRAAARLKDLFGLPRSEARQYVAWIEGGGSVRVVVMIGAPMIEREVAALLKEAGFKVAVEEKRVVIEAHAGNIPKGSETIHPEAEMWGAPVLAMRRTAPRQPNANGETDRTSTPRGTDGSVNWKEPPGAGKPSPTDGAATGDSEMNAGDGVGENRPVEVDGWMVTESWGFGKWISRLCCRPVSAIYLALDLVCRVGLFRIGRIAENSDHERLSRWIRYVLMLQDAGVDLPGGSPSVDDVLTVLWEAQRQAKPRKWLALVLKDRDEHRQDEHRGEGKSAVDATAASWVKEALDKSD